MADINIKLPEPEDINRQITEAIAKSAIGEQLNQYVQKEVTKLANSYNNPVEKAVSDAVQKLLYQIIKDEYEEIIKTKIRELLTDELLGEITMKAIDAAWKRNQY